MWKAIVIIALTLGLEAGFLLNAAIPERPVTAEAQQDELLARARAEQACDIARLEARAAKPSRS
jgi:hypothetical protein